MKVRQMSVFMLLSAALFQCSKGKELSPKECVSVNNSKAVENLLAYDSTRDTSSLRLSLEFYNKATKCDSLNTYSYQGKLMILSALGRFEDALKTIDTLYRLSKKTDIGLLTSKGIVFERMGKMDSSKVYYDLAYGRYAKRLLENPGDSLAILQQRLYLIAITQGKEKAQETLRFYLENNPTDFNLRVNESALKNFDRKVVIP